MAKFWKFLSGSIVVVVCLGLTLVPAAPPQVALASGNVTVSIDLATTSVSPNGSFTIDTVINNPNGMEVAIAMIELDFDPSYFTVDSVTKIDFPEDMGAAAIDNVNGTISYQPKTVLGTSINLTTIISARINCTAKSLEGISTVNWVYEMGPPPRWTTVEYGATDYLEGGDMSLMHNGTVIVGTPTYNLTISSTGGGNVTMPGEGTFGPYNATEVVALVATPDTNYSFVNWTGDTGKIGDVNSATTNITMNGNYTIMANFAEIVTAAILEGHVTFTGRGTAPDSRWIEPFNVTLFEAGNFSNVLWTGNATTNSTGVFNITGLDPGTYDIGIKNLTCLSEVNTSVMLTAGNTTVVDFGTTREGDIDNSDWVYLGDLSAFCTAWDTKPGDGGWNANADLDRNDWVYLGDLSLFCCNWDQKGDAYGYFV